MPLGLPSGRLQKRRDGGLSPGSYNGWSCCWLDSPFGAFSTEVKGIPSTKLDVFWIWLCMLWILSNFQTENASYIFPFYCHLVHRMENIFWKYGNVEMDEINHTAWPISLLREPWIWCALPLGWRSQHAFWVLPLLKWTGDPMHTGIQSVTQEQSKKLHTALYFTNQFHFNFVRLLNNGQCFMQELYFPPSIWIEILKDYTPQPRIFYSKYQATAKSPFYDCLVGRGKDVVTQQSRWAQIMYIGGSSCSSPLRHL